MRGGLKIEDREGLRGSLMGEAGKFSVDRMEMNGVALRDRAECMCYVMIALS